MIEEFKVGIKTLMISDLIIDEIDLAREEIRNKLNETTKKNTKTVLFNNEVIDLAKSYINEGVLSNKCFNDALHIALATINNADILTSWNFKHIVNINRIRIYNSINLRKGYKILEIRTPREIINL